MSHQNTLTQFSILGLRGRVNIEVTLKDNTLILVGENGSGKTTFLRMMFYFLSGRFSSLMQFEFDRISATIDGNKHELRHKDLKRCFSRSDPIMLSRLPTPIRLRIREAEAAGRFEEATAYIERYYGKYPRGPEKTTPSHAKALATVAKIQAEVVASLKSQILYLPTYRRIERELSSIFAGVDPEELRKGRVLPHQGETDEAYIELVEFGMADVQKAIESKLEEVSRFSNAELNSLTLSYLGDVVNRDYISTARQEISNAPVEYVSAVLNRVSNTILNIEQKQHLREIVITAKDTKDVPSEHEQILYHYFTKLLRFQSQMQEKESSITLFCKLCSEYIVDKKFVYDGRTFTFRIEWAGRDSNAKPEPKESETTRSVSGDVRLSDLSSGEKQIVSLFSHLYLSGMDRFFVLIDEPELSLSVPWQRRFLEDIRKGNFCAGLVAVTHSPFIYDNSLRPSTHALGEFIQGPDWGNLHGNA